jgi:hypothetical protein
MDDIVIPGCFPEPGDDGRSKRPLNSLSLCTRTKSCQFTITHVDPCTSLSVVRGELGVTPWVLNFRYVLCRGRVIFIIALALGVSVSQINLKQSRQSHGCQDGERPG